MVLEVKSEHVEFLSPLYFYFIKDTPIFSGSTIDGDNQWNIATLLEKNRLGDILISGTNGLPQEHVR